MPLRPEHFLTILTHGAGNSWYSNGQYIDR